MEADLDILKRIPAGRRVIATVPDFSNEHHVRHFSSCDEVSERHATLFESFRVDAILANDRGKTVFLFEGAMACSSHQDFVQWVLKKEGTKRLEDVEKN